MIYTDIEEWGKK